MPPNQAKAILESEWSPHKDDILRLFKEGNLEYMRQEMEKKGFIATKSQYEAQFRKWRIRKNRKQDDWKSICTLVKIRESEGKGTDVYIDGKLVAPARLRKEMSRYRPTLDPGSLNHALVAVIPAGFSIQTPANEQHALSLQIPSRDTEIFLPIRPIPTANLPSSIVEKIFSASGVNFAQERPHFVEHIDPRFLSVHISDPNEEETSTRLKDKMYLHGNALQLISEFQNGTFCNLRPLVSTLRSILPSVVLQDLEGCVNLRLTSDFINSALTRLIISATTNASLSLQSFSKQILKCLQNPTNERLLQNLQTTNSIELEAFAENLFCAGVESSNAGIVEILLRMSHIDHNRLVCSSSQEWVENYTPLELAAQRGSKEVVKLLIGANADVNKSLRLPKTWDMTMGALGRVFGMNRPKARHVDLELVRILLDAGAIFDVESYTRRGLDLLDRLGANILMLLITFYFSATATRHIAVAILKSAIHRDSNENFPLQKLAQIRSLTREIIIGIVQRDFKYAMQIFSWERGTLDVALAVAAEQGHLALVKACLKLGAIPTEVTLVRGIRSGHQELIKYLINGGADINRCSIIMSDYREHEGNDYRKRVLDRRKTSPLAEAIRFKRVEILEILASRDAWLHITDHSQFDAVLNAASEAGNVELTRNILAIAPRLELYAGDILGALLSSINGNQEEIALMILDFGLATIWSKGLESIQSFRYFPWLDDIENKSPILQALVQASYVGNTSIVQKLLDLRPRINQEFLVSALLMSIKRNHKHVTTSLLCAGAKPSSDCIASAMDNNDLGLVSNLLQAGADLKAFKMPHNTFSTFSLGPCCDHRSTSCDAAQLLVLKAVNLGVKSIIERFLRHGAVVDEVCNQNNLGTALIAAVKKRDIGLVELLLENGANVNIRTSIHSRIVTPLSAAVMHGDLAIVDILLDKGANVTDQNVLQECLLRRDGQNLVEKLLKAFCDQDPLGKNGFLLNALQIAIDVGNLDVIPRILQLQVGLNNFTALMSHKVKLEEELLTPLGLAIRKDQGRHLDLVRMLLDAGGDPNSVVHGWRGEIRLGRKRGFGRIEPLLTLCQTAILEAIETKNLKMVDLLVSHHATVDTGAVLLLMRTPLQKATEVGSFEIVEYLLAKGVPVNAPPAPNGGATALQLAAIKGYTGIAELLLNTGADPNAPAAEENGRTAMEGAAEYGRIDMLRLLANAGAKMNSEQFAEAVQLAETNGHMATKKYLERLFYEQVDELLII